MRYINCCNSVRSATLIKFSCYWIDHINHRSVVGHSTHHNGQRLFCPAIICVFAWIWERFCLLAGIFSLFNRLLSYCRCILHRHCLLFTQSVCVCCDLTSMVLLVHFLAHISQDQRLRLGFLFCLVLCLHKPARLYTIYTIFCCMQMDCVLVYYEYMARLRYPFLFLHVCLLLFPSKRFWTYFLGIVVCSIHFNSIFMFVWCLPFPVHSRLTTSYWLLFAAV